MTVSEEDYICKLVCTIPTFSSIVFFLAYVRHEAKRCLFTAKRDFCFFERRAFKVRSLINQISNVNSVQIFIREEDIFKL